MKPLQPSEIPPALVGATLSCLEVPILAKGLHRAQAEEAARLTGDGQSAPLGLFLFGGDDDQNRQTDILMVFYLQDQKWRRPICKGRPPSRRSRHTASVVTLDRKQRLLIFGGVGATNAVSLLDPVEIEWTHPAARAAQKDMERARRRKKSSEEPEMLLPCARFGHTAVVEAHAGTQRLIIFGGADFKGALGDVYELNMSLEQPEWSRPEITGLAPPPSVKHCAALVRGHMVLISGEKEWGGHVWALRLQPAGQMMWLRSAVPDFPLLGISRHAMLDYVRPRPNRREEILIFGGVLEMYTGESQVLDSFFTLDLRTWHETESELPRQTWGDIEKSLRAAGKDEKDIIKKREEWEEDMKFKQKQNQRAERLRRRNLFGAIRKDASQSADGKTKMERELEQDLADPLADDEELAAKLRDLEFELPPEMMPTISFGEWVPLRVGSRLPPARFGHAMCMGGSKAYIFGGRDKSDKAPVRNDLYAFECVPLAWRAISYDGDGPGTRVSHAMLQIDQYLYVLGGGSGNRSFNDLHRLDLLSMHWELIHTRGELPGSKPDALIGHSVQWVDPFLVVFAGGDGRKPSNELHTLEVSTAVWRKIDTQGAPPAPRVGHSSTQLGAHMYIIGGFSRGKYFHDVHVLDVERLQWTQQTVLGTPPHGRVSHSATLYKGAIHIFGGSAGGTCYNDYVVLNPAERVAPPAAGAAGDGRGAAGAGGGRSTITVGGKGGGKPSRNAQAVWSFPEVSGIPPEPRFAHTATTIGASLFIVGGLSRKGKPHDTLHVLDLGVLEWSFPRMSLEGPPPRGRHTCAAVGSVLFIFGGGSAGSIYDDVWALDVDGQGMRLLETIATEQVLGPEGTAAAARRAKESQIPMSFLVPHMLTTDEEPFYPPEEEYEDVVAREADADEVRSWLMHLGLAQYAYTFEVHEIDFSVLLELQEHDLKDMRIDDPTARLKLLHGIDVLRARGSLAAAGRAPRERLFRERYRLGAEVNYGGSPALLAVDCKTDLKVVVKFVASMAEYHRQLQLYNDLKEERCLARLADSYAALPGRAALGSRWRRLGNRKPTSGTELDYPALAAALLKKSLVAKMAAVTFDPKEMELLPQLSEKIKQDSFIKAGEEYFEQSAHDIADLQRGWGLPCLVLEYGECSLADYMSRGLLPLIELKATFEALIRPVLVLHGKRLAHCGLQPESFRLYDGVNWRLATADSITPFGEPMPAKCPICYAAPEAVRPLRHRGGVQAAASALLSLAPAAASLDVWSLGVLLWQFFSQQPLFCSEHEAFEMATATVGQLEPSLGCVTDLQARHLLHKMLQREPRERIDSHKIAKHSYLTGGLDEVELESTFGPMQKGQLFLRNLLLQMAGSPGGR